jgi:hypothetical protein
LESLIEDELKGNYASRKMSESERQTLLKEIGQERNDSKSLITTKKEENKKTVQNESSETAKQIQSTISTTKSSIAPPKPASPLANKWLAKL